VLGEVLVGDEAPEVDHPAHPGCGCGCGEPARGVQVLGGEVSLADGVHQEVGHLDVAGIAQGAGARPGISDVELQLGDVLGPVEGRQLAGVARRGHHRVTGLVQGDDEA
jgi:hypothetical protein